MDNKALSIFLLRFSTGIYLALWGVDKLINASHAASLSDRFYGGLVSSEFLIPILGILQVIIGLMVMLGLFRSISYKAQLAWYAVGIIPIITYIIDPLGLYLADRAHLTWFPSTTLLFASIVLVAFKEFDTMSLDHKRGK